jgi:hypothetical protein
MKDQFKGGQQGPMTDRGSGRIGFQ